MNIICYELSTNVDVTGNLPVKSLGICFFLWNKVDWTCLCLFRATATNRQYAARLIFQEILTVGRAGGTVGGARGTVGGAVKGTTSDTQFTQPHVCFVPAVRPSAVGLHDDQRRQGIREYSLNAVQK